VRFGKWDEILALPAPRADTLFTRATRSYARGMALIRKNDFAAAPRRSIRSERSRAIRS
jgi:hypothetical protein